MAGRSSRKGGEGTKEVSKRFTCGDCLHPRRAWTTQVAFGKVVCCPNHDMASISLALVQPHEGSQRVACGSCRHVGLSFVLLLCLAGPAHLVPSPCAHCAHRYDYDIFSGTVRRTKSEATNSADSFPILTRSLGFLKVCGVHSSIGICCVNSQLLAHHLSCTVPQRTQSTRGAAVHELDVLAPSGIARTFRVATTTADVPAQVCSRLSCVSSFGSLPEN